MAAPVILIAHENRIYTGRVYMSDMEEIATILRTITDRRSVRRYSSEPVSRALIKTLLSAAIWAPSAHNRQPWRFTVIETEQIKQELAKAMGEKLRNDLEADYTPENIIELDVQRSYDRITSAPVIIVLSLTMADMDVYPDPNRTHNEYIMAVQSTAMCGQNLLLAAHESGLGACWMCAPLFCPDVVRQVLNLPEDWQPQALLTLGIPEKPLPRKSRNPVENIVQWL